jgi:MscS family membrane protein
VVHVTPFRPAHRIAHTVRALQRWVQTRSFSRATGSVVVGLLLMEPAAAQVPSGLIPGAAPAAQEPVVEDSLGRSTPQGTVSGLLTAARQERLDGAAEYLDSGIRLADRRELARKLGVVLDRKLPNLDQLSDQPSGNLDDGLTSRDRVGTVDSSSGPVEILVERVRRGQNGPIWLFSSATLQDIPRLYDEIQPPWIEQFVPEGLRTVGWLSLPLYRWFGLVLLVPLLLGAAALSARVLSNRLVPLIARLSPSPVDHSQVSAPLRLLMLAVFFYAASYFGITLATRNFWYTMARILTVMALCWLTMRVVDVVAQLSLKRLARIGRSADVALVRLLSRLSKAAAVIVTGLLLLFLSDVDLTAALTGLGVGGLAIGFGAQKTIENLFGGIMVISDKPVNVGDVCKVGEFFGTVEDIGIRSTRIRTLDQTVVSVPNGQLAAMILENFAQRDRIRFHHVVGLQRQTTIDQLHYVLRGIGRLLDAHPRVDSASARSRLIRVSGTALEVEVFAYVLESEQSAFLAIQEELLLGILDIVETSGASSVMSAPPAAVPAK